MIVKMIDLQYPFPFVYLHVKIGSLFNSREKLSKTRVYKLLGKLRP